MQDSLSTTPWAVVAIETPLSGFSIWKQCLQRRSFTDETIATKQSNRVRPILSLIFPKFIVFINILVVVFMIRLFAAFSTISVTLLISRKMSSWHDFKWDLPLIFLHFSVIGIILMRTSHTLNLCWLCSLLLMDINQSSCMCDKFVEYPGYAPSSMPGLGTLRKILIR